MTRQLVIAVLLSLGFGFEGAGGAFTSNVDGENGSLAVHGGIDEPLPTPRPEVTPKKRHPPLTEVVGGAPMPTVTAVSILPTQELFRPSLLGLGFRLGRAPPRA